ncbi:alanine racemase [Yinghuangia aomiensis]
MSGPGTFDAFDKGLWLTGGALSGSRPGVRRTLLFDGPFTYPVMVARQSALDANIATMAAYIRRHGMLFAPHGKTSMAPKLFAAQLAAGAWGITVATPNQALAARNFGVPRLLLANEVLDPRALRWIAEQVRDGAELPFYVDSPEGVPPRARSRRCPAAGWTCSRSWAGRAAAPRYRSTAEAVALARTAADAGLGVAGVAGYEGGLPDADAVTAWLRDLVAVGDAVAETAPGTPIVSAGGSAWFDVVAAVLGGLPDRTVGFSAAARASRTTTATHRRVTPFVRHPDEGALDGALDVWAQVLSAPEPGLAILGAGRRDVPFDLDLPVPRGIRGADGTVRPAGAMAVVKLDDQHAYAETRGTDVRPGDLVRLGISHPCTAFDKWRVIPVVDDAYRVTDVLRTYF